MLKKRFMEYLFLWMIGGSLYYSIEILFRGYSHYSMFILGGICMIFIAIQGQVSHFQEAMWIQGLRSGCFVTSCEFITGLIVNKWYKLDVWDYTEVPFNVFGQICLPFALLFTLLSVIAIVISSNLLHYVFHEEKPKYRWF